MKEETGRREIPIQDGPAAKPDEQDGTPREAKVVPGSAAAKAYQQQAEQAHGDTPPYTPPPAEPSPVAPAAPAVIEAEELRLLETKLLEAENRIAELSDQLARRAAEFENFRKRTEREKAATAAYAAATLMRDLLPVVDHLALALESGAAKPEVLHAGVSLIMRQLQDVLGKHGLEEIPALGLHFDPSMHEALMSQPSAEHEEGAVVSVLQTGYRLGGTVLRPARVAVATPPADDAGADSSTPDNA